MTLHDLNIVDILPKRSCNIDALCNQIISGLHILTDDVPDFSPFQSRYHSFDRIDGLSYVMRAAKEVSK